MCLEVHALFVTPDDSEIESINNLKVRLALPGAGHIGDRVYHHFLRGFQDRGIHLPFVHLLEILNIANLRGLGDSLTMAETFPAVVANGLQGICCKAAEYQVAANQCASADLRRIAVHYHYVFRFLSRFGVI
jgi:hypothetical protein